MELTIEIHLLAGIGALTMGAGVLLANMALRRSRLFAWLCGSLALWNLGAVAVELGGLSRSIGEPLFLVGSCASAPLALDLSLMLTGLLRRFQRWLVRGAWVLATGLWLTYFIPAIGSGQAWDNTALLVLGGVFLLMLGLLAIASLRAGHPAERSVMRRLFFGGSVAVAGGLSDFLPRESGGIPEIGALAILVFLIVLCSAVVQYRFLDAHVLLVRAAALLAGAGVASMLVVAVVRMMGVGVLPVYLVMIPLFAAAIPLGRAIVRRSARGGRIAEVLAQTSARLPRARTHEELRAVIEEGRSRLPRGLSWVVYAASFEGGNGDWKRIYQSRAPSTPELLSPEQGVAALLCERGRPLTRPELQALAAESGEVDENKEALVQIDEWGLELLVPLSSEHGVAGLMGLGGLLATYHLGPDVCTSLMAVGQQAMDAFERIEANELARRQQALAAVGEMAAGLAHEVQNPVAAIRGAAQLLLSGTDPEEGTQMLEVIEEETDRLGRVVREFLEYARPATVRREAVDLEKVFDLTRRGLTAAGMTLEVVLEVDPAVRSLDLDIDQFQRALGNLLRNACEAGASRVRVEGILIPGERIRLRIEDDGTGFQPQDLPRLFLPFFTRGKKSGTGLGLALAARVVEAHGGVIRAENPGGGGAAFVLELPVRSEGGRKGEQR